MKRITTLLTATLLYASLGAQQTTTTDNRTTTSILRINHSASALSPATAAMAYHRPKYKAGIALLVIGPVDMAVGMGLIGWSIRNTGMVGDIPADNRRVALGAALGAFHLLSGAAITAGGAVLLHKGRRESGSVYLRMPQPALRVSKVNGNGFGVRTGMVF